MSENLFETLFDASADPSRPLLQLPTGAVLSYEDCQRRAGQFANALVALGVRPGDRVAVQLAKSAEAFCLYLGSLQAGAVFLPLNPGYVDSELAYFFSDAQPALIVCQPESLGAVSAVAARAGCERVYSLGANCDGDLGVIALRCAQEFDIVARRGDDLAAILYTSGTTGWAKGAMLSHDNLCANGRTLCSSWCFGPEDVLIHALPIFHAHGLFVASHVTMMAGGSMIFLPGFDAGDVLSAFGRATSMMGVPTYYTRLLAREDFTRELVQHMRLFVSGSAPLSADVHQAFEARTGHAILERYGMTETGMNASNPYDGVRRPGTVGLSLPGVQLRIGDLETGAPLPVGDIGVIEVRGANVFKGYWGMPRKTREAFRDDGFFITGDLGRLDEDGYVYIAGRDKDLIITGGLNVYPAEVEAVLDQVDCVAESAVIGVPHADFGEGVTAVVVLQPNASLREEDLRQILRGALAKYKVPKRVFFVDELPRNAMGKVEKARLRQDYGEVYEARSMGNEALR